MVFSLWYIDVTQGQALHNYSLIQCFCESVLFLVHAVFLADRRGDRRVSFGDSVDPHPCGAPHHFLPIPSPLFPADVQSHQTPRVHQ